MNRTQATEEIKTRWKELYPADKKHKGIICPLCGNGSGADGTGIAEYKASGNHCLKCFVCGFSGSVIDLYMEERKQDRHDKRAFAEAVNDLAQQLGIRIEEETRPETPSFHGSTSTAFATDSMEEAIQQAAPEEPPADYIDYYRVCRKRLQESAEAQAYLRRRGISLETACKWFVGFDPAWISPTVVKQQEAQGSTWKPDPKPVIVIPSTRSHYVTRDIRPEAEIPDEQKRFRKMNEGTPGIFAGAALSSDAETIFVTEGAFDALSIMEAGGTAIALNSTSNADKLIDQLTEHPTKATLILCLDNDEAGKRAEAKLKEGLRRQNIKFATADLAGGSKDPNEALTADREQFFSMVEDAIKTKAARPDNTLTYLDRYMIADLEKFQAAQNRKTGFANLDEKAGGLYPGLYVLAAISSLGKTTFALQMADQLAEAGHEVLFFSLEQSRLELVSKSLTRLTKQRGAETTSLAIRQGNLNLEVMAAIRAYKESHERRMSVIEGNFNCDIGYIRDYVTDYQKRTGATPVVFIDYLQILQPAADGKSARSKKDEIDLAVTELRRLSRELNLTIIVISSLNRANYMSPFSFESLKESGGIEYTADTVWGLQLQCLDEPTFADPNREGKAIAAKRDRINQAKTENPRKIKLVCLKNRNGIACYECWFDYYPQHDLFVPGIDPQGMQHQQKKAGQPFNGGGRR